MSVRERSVGGHSEDRAHPVEDGQLSMALSAVRVSRSVVIMFVCLQSIAGDNINPITRPMCVWSGPFIIV